MEDEHRTRYWPIHVGWIIFGIPIAFVAFLIVSVNAYDSGRASGVAKATNYIAAKCTQKREFKVVTGLSTFYFQCNQVKDVPVTPWDDINTDQPFEY